MDSHSEKRDASSPNESRVAMSRRLFVFDMDGTLLPGSSGLIELAKALNTVEALNEMERRYSSGCLNTRDFTYAVSELWGPISPDDSARAFANTRLLEGIRDCLDIIRRNDCVSCLITMSQDVYAEHFRSFGFDYVHSTTYPPHSTGPVRILDPSDKSKIARDICRTLGLDFSLTVAFGDSLSDEPLFSEISETVSVNGTPALSAISKHKYIGSSLLDAFDLLGFDGGT